jgi:hypothetical protein
MIARAVLWLPLAAFVLIAGVQFLGPMPVGLADNGDFARVLGKLSLWPAPPYRNITQAQFRYFVDDYVVAYPRLDSGVPSSEWLIAALAKKTAGIVLPRGHFNLRVIGVIHAAILVLALFIFLKALRNRPPWLRLVKNYLTHPRRGGMIGQEISLTFSDCSTRPIWKAIGLWP